MDRIFIEQYTDTHYRIAAIDKERIFKAEDPGKLATIFDVPLQGRTREDDAQIFYALAPTIEADQIFIDLTVEHRSQKLNTWNITVDNKHTDNIFLAVRPLDYNDRVKLYSTQHSITPNETVVSSSDSIFTLVAFSEKQMWKTGILQRCIDCLVLPQHRCNSDVYAVIDQEYRRIMRFKLETENPYVDHPLLNTIKQIVKILGLKHSHDDTFIPILPNTLEDILADDSSLSLLERLSNTLNKWSGASVISINGGFQLQADSTVMKGISYMQPWLSTPDFLIILETPM